LDVMDDALATWLLPMVPVGDIWGIGRKTGAKLQKLGIYTAADLRDMPTKQARAVGSVVLERTVLELQGEACIAFDDIEPQRKGTRSECNWRDRRRAADQNGTDRIAERRSHTGNLCHDSTA
jgi:nucleotidyltransferase/DNA polymerase involved in DNA repair